MNQSEYIGHGYFFIKNYIISKGFSNEIDWQEHISLKNITESTFLEEIAWVILSSGMNEKVIKKIFPDIKKCMYNFKSGYLIVKNEEECINNSLKIFNHTGKINAIIFAANYINESSFDIVKSRIEAEGINFLLTFPYIGKATSCHLAKNLGINVAKPDRHLIKITKLLGYKTPEELCNKISLNIDEKVSLVDLVIWRYATLDKNYIEKVKWFANKVNLE